MTTPVKSKYYTNNYILLIFDKVGTKQKSEIFPSYTSARTKGESLPEDRTFVITRVLYNSVMGEKSQWGYYPEENKLPK